MAYAILRAEVLTRSEFSTFGDVIEHDPDSCLRINNDEVLRHHDLARVEVTAENGRPVISLFQVVRPASPPFLLRLMERHPISSQAFIPLDRSGFLIVVAPPEVRPDIDTMRCFMARDGQGINLHPGVWHHPLIALETSDFLVVDRVARSAPFAQDYEEVVLADQHIQVTLETERP